MLRNILNVTAKIILGIFAFYLFLSFIVIPFGSAWAIRSQGTKLLKHTVKVRSIQLNPFLLRLSIHGLEILDAGNQVMAGFEKLAIDVSFVRLFKKEYRVESLVLAGLKINAVLLPGGKINLLELVPAPAGAPQTPVPTEKSSKSTPVSTQPSSPKAEPAKPLPLVIIDDIAIKNSNIRFVDQTVTPNFVTTINGINIHVTGVSTKPDAEVRVVYDSKLDDRGDISIEALLKPFVQPLQMETAFKLKDYALPVVTPYVGKYTGHGVKDGKLDVSMNYRISENKLTATHKLLVQRFDFGDKVESKDALSLPFGLALALLEDPQGKIDISLPVNGDMSDPEFHYVHLIGQVVRNFFIKLVTKPFSFLASVIASDSGTTDELGTVRFVPGKADLSDAEKTKLATLIKGLKERPKLSLEVNGSSDADVDWKAIKTEVFQHDFQTLTEESKRTEVWVYQQLYERRFGIRALWAEAKKFRSKDGKHDEAAMNAELKRQMIEDAPADKVALDALAQTRSKVVYDFILASGFDTKRITLGQNHAVQSSMGFVPLEFTLKVFGDQPVMPPVTPAVP